MTVQALAQAFRDELECRPLKVRTLRSYRDTLKTFLDTLESTLDSHLLGRHHLGKYMASMQRLADTTRAERCRQVRSFLNWASEQGFFARNPAVDWKWPTPQMQAWIPVQNQVLQLLKAPPTTLLGQRDQLVLELLYGSGLRRSEASALNVTDFEPDPGGLWVRQGKGQKDRLQPVGPHLSELIQDYLDRIRPALQPAPDQAAMLLTRHGRRLQHYSVAGLVRIYATKLNMPKMTAHSLRRAYANHMLQNGASVAHLQALLDHQSPETTIHYTQVTLEELQQEYRRCHPRAQRKRPSRGRAI